MSVKRAFLYSCFGNCFSVLGPVHTNPFSNENGAVFAPFSKRFVSTLIVFARPHYNTVSVLKSLLYPQCACSNAHFSISAREIDAKLKPHGSVCPPFWILTVEWSGARSCVFWSRHRFQIASSWCFSVHTRKQRFQKASFSNRSTLKNVFEWLRFHFWRCLWTIAVFGAKQLRFRLKTD